MVGAVNGLIRQRPVAGAGQDLPGDPSTPGHSDPRGNILITVPLPVWQG
jgi:hypothetical protein